MSATPIPLRRALDRVHVTDGDAERAADDRVRVLVTFVERQLGPLVDRPTASVQEVADLFGVSAGSIYEAVRAGTVPHLKVGRSIRIPIAAVIACLLGIDARPDNIP